MALIDAPTGRALPETADGCLTVVMPAFNEEDTILEAVKRVLESPYTGQLVVIDDGSTDGTPSLLESVHDPRVEVVVHPRNLGKGAALRRGFAAARQRFVVVQDADLEYDPAEFAVLLAPLLDGRADVVFGSRFQQGRERRVQYFWHSLGNRMVTTLSNMTTNLNLTDVETCYKAFRREVIQSIELEQNRFGIEPEITAKLAIGGNRIFEVGISYSGRTYEEGKKTHWTDGVVALLCVLRYSRLGWRMQRALRRAKRHSATYEEADQDLLETLHSLRNAENYADWIFDIARPHVGARVLEVGAGHGDMTERLRKVSRVTALELSSRSVPLLRERFAGVEGVEVVHADILDPTFSGTYDTAIAVNVLEHIPDAVGALARMRDLVEVGGSVIVFVPALEALYSSFDRQIGHVRRYHKRELERHLLAAGLEPVSVRYMNLPGALVWWLYAAKLGQTPTKPANVRLFDTIAIPVIRRIEALVPVPFGQSLLAVARRPAPQGSSATS
jgi:glycosyltransferase involved in cell wall biosynthesis